MEDEPRLPSFDRWWRLNDTYELAEDAASALATDGLLAVRGCLSAETASELSAHIDEQLVVRMAEAKLCEEAASRWFGNVYERSGRWDLRLSTESPIVKNALRSLVTALFPLLEQIVTCDAFLVELASVISDPGAQRQPFHSDTAWAPWPLYTIFIALQGIDALMGPTQVAPGTHSEERHHLLSSHAEGADAAVCKGDGGRPYIMSCNAGDGFVMDSRLYHCGGVRASPRNDPCNHLPLSFGALRTAHINQSAAPSASSGQSERSSTTSVMCVVCCAALRTAWKHLLATLGASWQNASQESSCMVKRRTSAEGPAPR